MLVCTSPAALYIIRKKERRMIICVDCPFNRSAVYVECSAAAITSCCVCVSHTAAGKVPSTCRAAGFPPSADWNRLSTSCLYRPHMLATPPPSDISRRRTHACVNCSKKKEKGFSSKPREALSKPPVSKVNNGSEAARHAPFMSERGGPTASEPAF